MGYRVGLDLGGTKLRAVLVDEGGEVLGESLLPTETSLGVEGVVERVVDSIKRTMRGAGIPLREVEFVGIGAAGQISPDRRTILYSPNLKWRDVPLGELVQKRLGVEALLENDVRAAAVGERYFGAGVGRSHIICIFVGTGVGSGIFINGELLRGGDNLAGEVGHMKLNVEGPPCSCGGRGCLEAYAGGAHVQRRFLEALREGERSILTESPLPTIRDIEEAAERGDSLAMRFWREVRWALGVGVANLVTLLNPELVILGGGVIEASPSLVEHTRRWIRAQVTMLSAQEVEVVKAALGPRAGAIGATLIGH